MITRLSIFFLQLFLFRANWLADARTTTFQSGDAIQLGR